MNANQAIDLIDQAVGFKMSKEQEAILRSGLQVPTLINACAGSGKTTTLMMSILYQAMLYGENPQNVLGITFSKQAQESMVATYNKMWRNLLKVDPRLRYRNFGIPVFRTFHAFFFGILKELSPNRHFKVVYPSDFTYELYKKIKKPIKGISMHDNVKPFTDLMSKMMAFDYSSDGLDPNFNNPTLQVILSALVGDDYQDCDPKMLMKKLLVYQGFLNDNTWESYQNVVLEYQRLKSQKNGIDFDDMQSMLSIRMQHPAVRAVCQSMIKKFSRIYIDEFQDINPMQWFLMQELLSSSNFNHLVTVGDDDQSIYRFRGANPNFILHFDKKIKNARHFNLSINYRVPDKILEVVKPVIVSNRMRLNKSLTAFHSGGMVWLGHHKDSDNFKNTFANDWALAKLCSDIKKYPKRSFAILSHDNIYLSLLSDTLYHYHINVGLGHARMILQNHPAFKLLFQILKSVYTNDFYGFETVTKQIGFSRYKKHVDDCMQSEHPKTLDQYLAIEGDYDTSDKEVGTLRFLMKSATASGKRQKQLIGQIIEDIGDLVSAYVGYVTSNGYVSYSYDDYQKVFLHLLSDAEDASSIGELIKFEEDKQVELLKLIDTGSRVRGLTMHGAKGLEFDEVFVFGHTKTELNNDYELTQFCQTDWTYQDFLKNLKQQVADTSSFNVFKYWLDHNLSSVLEIAKSLSDSGDSVDLRNSVNEYSDPDSSDSEQFFALQAMERIWSDYNLVDVLVKTPSLGQLVYLELHQSAMSFEEDKRVWYVALTRARQSEILDMPMLGDADAFSFENLMNLDDVKKIQDPSRNNNED